MMLMSTKALQQPDHRLRVTKISIDMPSTHDPTANIRVELLFSFFTSEFNMKISLTGDYGQPISLEQNSNWDKSHITWSKGDFDSQFYRFTSFSKHLVPFLALFSKREAEAVADELDFGAVHMNIQRVPHGDDMHAVHMNAESELTYRPLSATAGPGSVRAGFFTIKVTEDKMLEQRCIIDKLKARLIMMPLRPLTLRRHSA